jgi:acyl-[acyl-carrier-protein]-phospholipid O-acyltransferase/long-chain-fatty-acid--[acyl-carrier-protein] ligase
MALALDKRVAVNLNYTVTSDVMNECIKTAGIKRVLTSRQVLSKLNLELDAEIIELENFKEKVTLGDKIAGALGAFVTPAWLLAMQLGLGSIKLEDEATVIFTSGSTGTPKGVMLTYANVASNVEAIEQVVHLTSKDVIVGILPFFHSFGYTVTMWTPMTLDIKSIYHYSPLDAKRIGMLCKKHKATVLLSTPTFLRSFLKRCTVEQFKTLDVVVAGAEKLPVSLCDAFEEKFGIRPVEGYGCTELSPLVSVNVPHSRSSSKHQKDRCEGSVGRPIPNVAAKTVDPETYVDLPVGEPGMLLIKGPNVMKGYMKLPEKTAQVIRDGWYVTGDLARIDDDGFIHITGRESRFSKIGGEMVPHIKIEEILTDLIGGDEEEGLKAAVTAVPDQKKGERLIVLHTAIDRTVDELRAGLSEAGLPNIYIPSSDSFIEISEMPVLGTGKLDLKGLKQTALDKTGC